MQRDDILRGPGVLALAALVLGACGGAPPPNDQIAASEAAVRGAAELGAANVPRASLHLKLAQEQIAQAKALIEDDENERAELVLLRAKADAELALALAREANARREADQAIAEVDQLSKTLK